MNKILDMTFYSVILRFYLHKDSSIMSAYKRKLSWVRFNVAPDTLQVISVTDFYGPNDPTNSVKALKEGHKD